jgi:chromosome segregation ATPase
MAQISLDTLNPQDVADVMSALQTLIVRNNLERIFCPIQEYNLVKDKLDSLTIKYQQQVDELNKNKEFFEKETKTRESLESQLLDLQSQLSELSQKYESQSEELKKCYERLDSYTIDYKPAGSLTEYIYFDVEKGVLKETTQKSAYYKAIKNGNLFEFIYNDEKAPHLKAINGYQSILEPFCEVESQIPQFPNYVENRGKGILSFEDGNLVVTKKARVRILRK